MTKEELLKKLAELHKLVMGNIQGRAIVEELIAFANSLGTK